MRRRCAGGVSGAEAPVSRLALRPLLSASIAPCAAGAGATAVVARPSPSLARWYSCIEDPAAMRPWPEQGLS
jgi:hypothetical protein